MVPEIGRQTPIYAVDSGGEIPSMIHPPAGCAFYDRCPLRRDRCRAAVPPTEEVSPGHTVACYAVAGGGGTGA